MTQTTACKRCTVPTDGTDVCNFCSSYVPPESPAQQLDVAVNRIDILRADLNKVLDSLPSDAPLFGCADLTTGICHLKRASEKINRAAEVLEADAQAVKR